MEVKKTYNETDWNQKEDYYIKESQLIVIPTDAMPRNIMQTASKIDALLSEALADKAFLRAKYEAQEQKVKLLERQLFIDLKLNTPPAYAKSGLKLTADEMKGIVTKQISDDRPTYPDGKVGRNQYEILLIYQKRSYFIDSVIDLLKSKKEILITICSMMKIENDLTKQIPKTA